MFSGKTTTLYQKITQYLDVKKLQTGNPLLVNDDLFNTTSDIGCYMFNHIFDCNDEFANNYNDNSTYDDGRCEYTNYLYVTTDGEDEEDTSDIDYGSEAFPYQTIGFAVEQAEDGYIIRVDRGTYHENIEVNKIINPTK